MPKFAKGHAAFRNKGALKVEKLFIKRKVIGKFHGNVNRMTMVKSVMIILVLNEINN